MENRIELPAPSREALLHSRRLADHIRSRIAAAGGWLDFAEFMRCALYAPGLGYYSAGTEKFGAGGDFVTAPEISTLFASCLARACAPALRPDRSRTILELGAGSGALAAALLESLSRLGARPDRYLILEVSADLRERQRARIAEEVPEALASVTWLDELPHAISGIVVANEVVDALPVSRFTIRDGEVIAMGVVASGDGFAWAPASASEALRSAVAVIESGLAGRLADGYTSEVCLELPAWVASIADSLQSGTFLAFDYGMSRREYYHPDRRDGTLTCHYRHRAHGDAFHLPGLQDITAWVDFTALADLADAAGLQVAGYATLGHFLLDAGIDGELASAAAPGLDDVERMRQARTLLLPGEMGERFKVLALGRGAMQVGGFGFRDLRHLL